MNTAQQIRAIRQTFLYATLLAGTAVFSLPFLWMIGTSFKVEREMAGSSELSFVPETPRPAQKSPYLDANLVPASRLHGLEAHADILRELIQERGLPEEMPGDADAGMELLIRGVYARLRRFVPDAVWDLEHAARQNALAERLSGELIAEVHESALRRLRLGMVRVRSLDMHEQDLTAATPPHEFWRVVSGPGSLHPNSADTRQAVLRYDFGNSDAREIVMESRVELPFPAERLHRSWIYFTPDDSWHNLFFELEFGGVLYSAARPRDTGENLGAVVLLQERSGDDSLDSTKLRLWIPYDAVAWGEEFDHGPNGLVLRVTLRQSTPAEAWWAKISRNYVRVLQYVPFWRYVRTSLFLVVLNVIGNLISCSIAAYAFARLSWPGRNLSFGVMLATMMIPPQVTMIPFFLIVRSLGLYNSLTPLWMMSFFGNAFNIFLLRQFMMGIPRDLEDAAKIDGCNFIHIYLHVILPLIKPTLACIAVFTFMGVWNDFMGPLIFLSDQRLYPLSLGLFALKVENSQMGLMMAGSMLMTLPVILVFAFAQRYFIQGIALTGTKG